MSFEDAERRADTKELRQALAAVAETATPREGCREPERLWDAVQGELPPEELKRIVDHTAVCPVCAESWRLAVELTREVDGAADSEETGRAPTEVAEAPPETEDGEGFWRSWLQVAALVAVLAGAGVVVRNTDWLPETSGPGAPVRSGDEAGITALTPQNQALPREGLTLRWTAPTPEVPDRTTGGGDLRYDVEVTWVTGASSEVIFQARDLERTALAIPPQALAALPPDAVVLWSVTAWLDGDPVDRKTFNIRLR